MPKGGKLKSTKKRVNVKDLPKASKKMSGKEMKKVKGGIVLEDLVVSSVVPRKTK